MAPLVESGSRKGYPFKGIYSLLTLDSSDILHTSILPQSKSIVFQICFSPSLGRGPRPTTGDLCDPEQYGEKDRKRKEMIEVGQACMGLLRSFLLRRRGGGLSSYLPSSILSLLLIIICKKMILVWSCG